jgi:hypothetical protein
VIRNGDQADTAQPGTTRSEVVYVLGDVLLPEGAPSPFRRLTRVKRWSVDETMLGGSDHARTAQTREGCRSVRRG